MSHSPTLSLASLLLVLAGCSDSHGTDDAGQVDAGQVDAGQDVANDAPTADAPSDDTMPGCPADVSAALDTPCDSEGQSCGTCSPDPCSFCNLIQCSSGTWQRVEVFPLPCHACGPEMSCESLSEYCAQAHSDVGGEPDMFSCRPLEGCEDERTCECLGMSIAFDRCSDEGGEVLVEFFGG